MIVAGLVVALVLVFGILISACVRIEALQKAAHVEEDHAMCLSMVAAFVGDEFAARVLQSASVDYDTAEGQAAVQRLSNTVWVPRGPSMPSLWMLDRAEGILAKSHHG